jgi:hypothetical protein
MAQSPDMATSRFSNWSQHLDFTLFRVLARQAPARKDEIDLGIAGVDKVAWEDARENPINWPRTRKAIHTVVPSVFLFLRYLKS